MNATETLSTAKPIRGLALVPLHELHPSPNNIRENLTDIDGLALSMREAGLIQPIIVQKVPGQDGYQIVAGHRRHAAAQKLQMREVPCIIRRDMLPDEELLAMLVENGQRAGLDPIEEARALKRLQVQTGLNDSELARKVGRNNAHVTRRLMLLSLPPEEQEQIRAGVTSLTEAHQIARVTTGRIRPKAVGRSGVGHLSASHTLAAKAKARCLHLEHSRGRGKGVGGVACGECWETVIRADERDKLHGHSVTTGRCALCDHTVPAPTVEEASA